MKFFYLTIFSIFLISCNKTYNFRFVNKTPFDLDSLTLGCAMENKILSIKSNSTINDFSAKSNYKLGGLGSQPLLCISVFKYSDSLKKYTQSIGSVIGINELSSKKINIITFDYSQIDTNERIVWSLTKE